jgi:hypothetical protein
MAKAEIKMPEDFMLKVSQLAEKTDTIIPKCWRQAEMAFSIKGKTINLPWSAEGHSKKAAPQANWNIPSVFLQLCRIGTVTGM